MQNITLTFCSKNEIVYTNWKGEVGTRRIIPFTLFFGSNEWHPDPQWLIEALDLDKMAMRTFALKGITHAGTPS